MGNNRYDRPSCSGEPAFGELLNYFVDGVLSADGQIELFEHLATCECCRDELDAIMTFRRMSRLEYIHVPPSVDDAFFHKLAAHKSPDPASKETDRSILSASVALSLRSILVAACVVFVVGLFIPSNIATGDTKIVDSTQERVSLAGTAATNGAREAVYVFYPGLTVVADAFVDDVDRMSIRH